MGPTIAGAIGEAIHVPRGTLLTPPAPHRLPVGAVDCPTVDCDGQGGFGCVGHDVRVCLAGGSFAESIGGSGRREVRVRWQRAQRKR